MLETTAKQSEWIEKVLVPKIARSSGRDNQNVRCKISFPENCLYLSYVCFIDLTFGENESNAEVEGDDVLKVVLKKLPFNSLVTQKMHMMKQFHNEILFYTQFASGNPLFPRCILAVEDGFDDTVIVLENICALGYEICPQAYDVPYEYALSAFKEIGRLHATGYVMKERRLEHLRNIVDNIQEPRFTFEGWLCQWVDLIATRPVDWLRRNNCDKKFCDMMERNLGNGFKDIMLPLLKPVEPLATLCHGDFTRNNVFFRRNNGELEAKIFDFALITYSSPAIDLSTFLYLNCSREVRVDKFEQLYRSYHEALIERLRDSGIEDLEKYSYDKMLADYKRCAAFGFMIAVFFFPIVTGDCKTELDTLFRDSVGSARACKEAGGERITEIFGKMVLELRNLGSLDHLS